MFTVTIKEYERGLDYRGGKFAGVLEAGRHRIWPGLAREIVKIDVRERDLQISGQEVLTSDNVPVRLNVVVRFRVADVEKAVHEVVSFTDAVYQAAQMVAREAVAVRSVEELVAERAALAPELTAKTQEAVTDVGIAIVAVAIKDAMLVGAMKAAYEAKLVADQKGKAALVEAQHQVAAARARANAARIVADNPMILAQQELDVLAAAAEKGYGNTFVVLADAFARMARNALGDGAATPSGK